MRRNESTVDPRGAAAGAPEEWKSDVDPVFVQAVPAALKPTLHASRTFFPTLGLRDT